MRDTVRIALAEPDGQRLGVWIFEEVPRIAEQVVLAEEYYQVVEVEHWPQLAKLSDHLPRPGIRVIVEPIARSGR